jgi:hypothetical protein
MVNEIEFKLDFIESRLKDTRSNDWDGMNIKHHPLW